MFAIIIILRVYLSENNCVNYFNFDSRNREKKNVCKRFSKFNVDDERHFQFINKVFNDDKEFLQI